MRGDEPARKNRAGSRLCRLDDLVDGDSRGFDPQGVGHDTVFVVRRGSDVHVYHDSCPHQGSQMAWRRHAYLNAARDRIVCHAHGAQFEIDTGVCVLGPCLGQGLAAVPHRIDTEGNVLLQSG
jgi:nitrite reductase/ring-hydroxylating ferredoxin subunit